MSAASAPLPAPVELYLGHTVHERRAPFTHRFRYRIASILIDLERLDEAGRMSRLFSVETFNLYSFRQRDHGPGDGSSLTDWARARFEEAGIAIGEARLRLMCFPRVLGYVFNPLSIYFAEGADGALKGVIYQVHNTFGDRHAYVAPCAGETPERQEADKAFHVSPFFDLGGRYEFTLRAPGEQFQLTIFKQRQPGPDLMATMALRRKPLTGRALASLFASQPFSTLKTISAIHFEALRLWMKGARYHPRPVPPGQASQARLSAPHPPASLGRDR
ncbi:DUF1365 domain-containing protein [Alkalicaulis satelles]|uniref:DUF1365 domain-containing protein n=1 Tax=Alkalicaulis satelles TaxID=2609175 RepID=A0A5M6ZJY1_9PROT|nr:DUF1365 domain-containing protein [Alkalicaulis satelles]KAA5805142.1 DUF1365 domain-containing protein [Alkalicaulis satelles]